MERMPEAEWGANPREWVTVMRARRAQSDTSEPDLCSCRHRESMDEFFVRTAGGCADFFVGRFSSPGRRRPESCTTHVLSGQSLQIPLCAALSNQNPLRRWEPPEGIFLSDPTAGGCGFPQDLLHLRPFFLHIRCKPQLRAAAVKVLRWPVDLEINIAVQIVL